jgi:hypothetical protein
MITSAIRCQILLWFLCFVDQGGFVFTVEIEVIPCCFVSIWDLLYCKLMLFVQYFFCLDRSLVYCMMYVGRFCTWFVNIDVLLCLIVLIGSDVCVLYVNRSVRNTRVLVVSHSQESNESQESRITWFKTLISKG